MHTTKTTQSCSRRWAVLLIVFLLEVFLATIVHCWSFHSFAKRNQASGALQILIANKKDKSPSSPLADIAPPPPPWRFQASKIHYQFHLFPEDLARKYTTPAQTTSDGNKNNPPPLTLLSFFGWTLGGVFCVEYSDSPIGPYREVAILSSLVVDRRWNLGAWASHIYVDSKEAVKYGQRFWGLPAKQVVQIGIDNHHGDGYIEGRIKMIPSIRFFDFNNTIHISGWETSNTNGIMERLQIGLPSFSGCLPIIRNQNTMEDPASFATTTTPLLRYPLTIRYPRSISLTLKSGAIDFSDEKNADVASVFDEIQHLLSKGKSMLSLDVGAVELEAGIPEIIES